MSLAQRITESEARIVAIRDKYTDHLASVDDSNVSDAQVENSRELREQLAHEQKLHNELIEAEKVLFIEKKEDPRAIVVRQPNGNGRTAVAETLSRPYLTTQRSPQIPNTKEERLELLVRGGVIGAFAHNRRLPLEAARQVIINAGYPRYGEEITKAFTEYLERAVSAPAMTTVTGWATELVQTGYADYLDVLHPDAVFPQLAAAGLRLSFGRNGRISIPMRDRQTSIAGSFVGEGMPIPVRQALFASLVLVPKKLAVITTFTREMGESSIPAIEAILRDAIQQDTAGVIDNFLMDANASTAIRPAGLRFGVTSIAGSTATPRFDAVVADLEALIGALLTSTFGNVRNVVILMNPQQVLAAKLTALPGVSVLPFMDQLSAGNLLGYRVVSSYNVPANMIIAIDAADFVVVGGEAPRFEISDSATLHMEDTAPQPITGGTPSPAVPVRSLWQTDSIGLRLVMPLNWAMRREGMVAVVSPTSW